MRKARPSRTNQDKWASYLRQIDIWVLSFASRDLGDLNNINKCAGVLVNQLCQNEKESLGLQYLPVWEVGVNIPTMADFKLPKFSLTTSSQFLYM